jgi:hypothetical protein
MPTYIWQNTETEEVTEITCLIRDRDIPPELPGSWIRLLQAPMVLKASYPDGLRMKSDQAFRNYVEASKLEVDYANSENKTERTEIRKTINDLQKA